MIELGDEEQDKLELKLKIKENSPKMTLHKNKLITSSAPVYVYENSKLKKMQVDEVCGDFCMNFSVNNFSYIILVFLKISITQLLVTYLDRKISGFYSSFVFPICRMTMFTLFKYIFTII